MAITCSFKKRYGTATCWNFDKTKKLRLDIWSDGNCDAVFTYGKAKNLAFFVSDSQHLRNCLKTPCCFEDIISIRLYADFKAVARFAKAFPSVGISVTILPRPKVSK